MKKLTIWIISASWILYVLVPIVYRIFFGKYPENLQSMGYVPEAYMTKAAVIITAVLFLSAVLIYCIPGGNRPIVETISCHVSYYYFALGIYFILAVLAGVMSFSNVITGGMNGTLYSYYAMLFYPVVLLLIYLFCVKDKRNVLMLVGAYLALTLLSHSRAGAVDVGIYLIGFALASDILWVKKVKRRAGAIYKKYSRQIKGMILVMIIAAPFIFIYSTKSRGSTASSNEHRAIETIAARCSCLDEAGLALYAYEESDAKKRIFLDKYGVANQIECIVDASIPGSLFGGDVDPNQYYRAMVGYMSEADAARYYTSVNLMLPVYMVMKYGLLGGMLFSTMLIVMFYLVVSRIRNPVWKVVLTCIVLRIVWKAFLRAALTIVVFQLITGYVHIRHQRIRYKVFR